MHSAELRRCLEDCDVSGARALWAYIAPHLPQPASDAETLATIHRARTEASSIPLKLRAYSHRWLEDQGLPSGLPDELKPKAERIYPRIAEAVGISANFRSPILKPAQPIIQGAMGDAVEECFADGQREPAFVKARLLEAKDYTIKKLFGSLPWMR